MVGTIRPAVAEKTRDVWYYFETLESAPRGIARNLLRRGTKQEVWGDEVSQRGPRWGPEGKAKPAEAEDIIKTIAIMC